MHLPQRIAAFLTRTGWNPRLIRTASRLHAALLRTRGLGGSAFVGGDTLILITRGRKSGRPTATPLFYAEDRGRLYVAGSFVGSGTPPNWYRNLLACPEVAVEVAGTRRPYRARTLAPEDADRTWPILDAVYPAYRAYRMRSAHPIPVVELSPAAHAAERKRS
jgi:deazaflavin-dependent oxidoreductase (nitroreductase family)